MSGNGRQREGGFTEWLLCPRLYCQVSGVPDLEVREVRRKEDFPWSQRIRDQLYTPHTPISMGPDAYTGAEGADRCCC